MRSKGDIITESFLRKEIVKKGRSIISVANDLGVHRSSIERYMRLFNINSNRAKLRSLLTKEYLQLRYITEKRTVVYISEETDTDVGTVYRKLKMFGIRLRRATPSLSKDDLERLYCVEEKTIECIAKDSGISYARIKSLLIEYNLPLRRYGHKTRRRKEAWDKSRKGDINGITGHYIASLINSASKRGITFNLTGEFLWELFQKQECRCALTGVDIKFALTKDKLSGRDEQTASLDRIDSNLGYEPNNVQWVHKHVNKIKQDLDEETFLLWCRRIVEHHDAKSNEAVR